MTADYQGLVTKWRKVQDEMPEYDTDLLLWSEAWGHIYVGYWRHSEEWIGRHRPESDESLPDTNPTHWAYFPAPPEAEVIARNVQPSPDADELRLDGIMASTPSGALDVIAPTYGGISRSNWPARPVQQPATELDEDQVKELMRRSKRLMRWAYRAVWSYEHGMRMGRDDAMYMNAEILNVAKTLGMLPGEANAKQVEDFYVELEPALTAPVQQPATEPGLKPVMQTKFGYPEGNCFAACVASLMGMSIDKMPEPEKEKKHFTTAWNDWFRVRGIGMTDIKAGSGSYIAGYCIASGKSPRGGETKSVRPVIHAVVCKDMELVHDPHPDGKFLDGPPTEYTVLYSLNPAALALRDVPQGQWIDVKERLPEPGEIVNIYIPKDGFDERFICSAYLKENKAWRAARIAWPIGEGVTHWMPLPAAPGAALQVPVGPAKESK